MRVLLDECVHRRLQRSISGHTVDTVQNAGWSGKKNGELLRLAASQFDVFITTDKNILHQHNPNTLLLPVVVVSIKEGIWEELEPLIPSLNELLHSSLQHRFYEIP
jgi:hypothetical protein